MECKATVCSRFSIFFDKALAKLQSKCNTILCDTVAMSQEQNNIIIPQRKKGARYPPETMQFVLSSACLLVVLESSEKVREAYIKIVESYKLPEMQALFKTIKEKMPSSKESLKTMRENPKEGKPWDRIVHYSEGLQNKVVGNFEGFDKWVDVESNVIVSKDYSYWYGLIEELIKVGFNNADNQAKGTYKVTIKGAQQLAIAIQARSYSDYRNANLIVDEDGIKGINIDSSFYDLENLTNIKPTSRKYRRMATRLKASGYPLRHDNDIMDTAKLWYQCRVVHPTIEKYLDAEAFEGST